MNNDRISIFSFSLGVFAFCRVFFFKCIRTWAHDHVAFMSCLSKWSGLVCWSCHFHTV
jgi:hypothetical protein